MLYQIESWDSKHFERMYKYNRFTGWERKLYTKDYLIRIQLEEYRRKVYDGDVTARLLFSFRLKFFSKATQSLNL